MLKFGQALKIVLRDTKPVETEWVVISRAHRRVLAEDVIAGNNIPYTDNSAMDGYAINTDDLKSVPRELPVVGVVGCGKSVNKRLKRGEAMAIMTGAPIPAGCNGVVPVEDTEAITSEIVRILRKIKPGKNVRYSGEDVRKGQVVLKRGTAVGAAELGMLASVGRKRVRVFRKPVVAILVTGNEIIEPGERLRPGKVRDINTYSLCGLVEKFGGVPLPLGIAGDEKVKLLRKMRKGLNSDVMIISGGVSMGRFDFVREALTSLGYRERLWKVAMKPGMPISFGYIGRLPVFGLPGNPVSSMVSFLEFVRPLMMRLVDRVLDLPEISAFLKTPVVKKDKKRHFLRVKLDYRNHKYFASLTGPQGSGILKSMVECDGIAVIPENAKSLKVGNRVTVQLVA
ncbi:MAG: molybdopterin molybdotransferase MoeA [Elusimicrobiota bacterium]|nr:molybdopterin molybdotransferase MoeA [Elusimicrobiota bacterium]